MMHETEIDLPVRTVYDQWTQFEDFPLFMRNIRDVRQIDDKTIEWEARIAGISREWRSEITEQSPDQRVAWTAIDGTKNSGVVTFHALSDDKTKVVVQFDMDPEGFLEHVADWGGFVSDRMGKDLEDFKEFIEARGSATGAWRGEVVRDDQRGLRRRMKELEELDDKELVTAAQEAGVSRPLDRSRDWLISAVAMDERERSTS